MTGKPTSACKARGLQGNGGMNPEQEKQKWPFDPMQPGDHEPVRIPDDPPAKEPAKEQKPPVPPQSDQPQAE
jgi:hypothetical protein